MWYDNAKQLDVVKPGRLHRMIYTPKWRLPTSRRIPLELWFRKCFPLLGFFLACILAVLAGRWHLLYQDCVPVTSM